MGKPARYSPTPEQLSQIADSLHAFLLAAVECKCVYTTKAKPPRRSSPPGSCDFEVHSTLWRLEMALNPRRFAFDDKRRTSTGAVGWPNIMRFVRLLRTLREGVDSTLKDWGWETLCGSTSLCLSGAGVDGRNVLSGTFKPGTAVIQTPYGWRPWVRQSVVDDLTAVRDAFLEYLRWYTSHHAPKDETEIDELRTLSQVAPLTGLTKRTLERHLKELPEPDVRGGNGKANKWYWSKIRPPLEKISKRPLPRRFPGSQIM